MRSETLGAGRPNRLSERELALLFYLGVPVFLGLLFGWIGAGPLGGQLPRPIANHLRWIIGVFFHATAFFALRSAYISQLPHPSLSDPD